MAFDVLRVGELARFEFTEEEVKKFDGHIKEMLRMISIIPEVLETEAMVANKVRLSDLREDVPQGSWDSFDVLANAPKKKSGFFVV
ncbi:MAG: Asp-tRNA(Asn)/Glu-tRNA(Gln) amidotransferase subunit GatC [Oscillospiraceae bacterium]|jgi:aspartyl/glutamyl-tRNA(Asn/Gln) amidotransferase C subunit|nr:Asp-tRNA(Asn)/Glu-tRNA(Gln) amidotransferase subunit GatC [Oscillospiraceae bacterium]